MNKLAKDVEKGTAVSDNQIHVGHVTSLAEYKKNVYSSKSGVCALLLRALSAQDRQPESGGT